MLLRYKISREIENIFQGSRRTYGSPRVHQILLGLNYDVSKSTVERIMKSLNLKAKKGRKYRPKTTDSSKTTKPAPNLVNREFDRGKINKVWLSDITYLKSKDERWVYLATVMDGHSRKIIGWEVSDNLSTSLPLRALTKAFKDRGCPSDVIYHSDRGCQYASKVFQSKLSKYNFQQSMSRKGNCWDNAPMESFFDTLKSEHTNDINYQNLTEIKRSLFEWIEVFYNRVRIHSSLGFKNPTCYEQKKVG